MSDQSPFGFGKFVPGFDFLQNLGQAASPGAAAPSHGMPNMASWVAPTLSVEELDKRIQELKAVQFWLDQNATALKATIQAMEVQKMTLSTLQGMNVNMADLAKAFMAKAPPAAAETPPFAAPADKPAAQDKQAQTDAPKGAEAPAVDPMQWWGALTQQFQTIAAAAVKDVADKAMKDAPKQAKAAPRKTPAQSRAKPRPKASASSRTKPA
ncbi:MAG: hypothetical protein EBQ86_06300 [Betaproteobacteria bacterium]|jgi:hypothetical protein|nr:hypothetical protein [Burkholderiales bacterium]NBX89684.1 hypothetical protein [Betaproteobacteria bacterium]